jgi:hypothetical protein
MSNKTPKEAQNLTREHGYDRENLVTAREFGARDEHLG